MVDLLPSELLSHAFQYSNAADSLNIRRVCWKWRDACHGCGFLQLKNSGGRTAVLWSGLARFGHHNPGVMLQGQKLKDGDDDNDDDLLAPSHTERPLEVVEIGPFKAALRYEPDDAQYDHPHGGWKTLDLAESVTFQMYQQGGFRRCRPGNPYWSLKFHLQMIDLTGLRCLDVLSLKECQLLEEIRLPTCLKELDASHCTRLRRIKIALGRRGGGESQLTRINFEQCGALMPPPSLKNKDKLFLFGAATCQILRQVELLNLDGVHSIPPDFIEWAMGETENLQLISLREVATDGILQALAISKSSREGNLCKVIAEYCPMVTDVSLNALMQEALSLETLDISECPLVSDPCHSLVATALNEKRIRKNGGSDGGGDYAGSSCRKRKIE